jgi:L-alanine-DL-glutamate epimerase-like enolase superfamily enzyme
VRIVRIDTHARPQVGVLRVTLDDGTIGWGQIASFEAADLVAEIVHRQIAPRVLGHRWEDIGAVLRQIEDRLLKFHGSHLSRGTAALETALVDAQARSRRQLVTEMLGGHTRPVPVYASSMLRTITPEDEALRLRRLQQEQGFRAFKVRVGSEAGHDRDEWPGRSEALVPAIRRALGPDATIHADGNSCYTPARAIEVGRLLQDHGYGHFEEPCPYWKLHWTREVTEALDMPVAGGEQDHAQPTWHTMIEDHVVDIVQPDICYIGGITVALDIARRAQARGLLCVPHCANHSLILPFTMHLWNALPNPGPYMEYSIEEQGLYAGLYRNPPTLRDGALHFDADGYGWGVRIDPDWLAHATHRATEADAT